MGTWRRDLGVLATLTAASWVHPHSVWGNTIKLYPLIQPSHLSIVYCSSVYLTVRASPWIHYHTSRIFHISHLCAVIPWEVLLLWPTFQHLIPRPSFPAAFFFSFIRSLPCIKILWQQWDLPGLSISSTCISAFLFLRNPYLYFVVCMHMGSVCGCTVSCGCLWVARRGYRICRSWRYTQLWAAECGCCEGNPGSLQELHQQLTFCPYLQISFKQASPRCFPLRHFS